MQSMVPRQADIHSPLHEMNTMETGFPIPNPSMVNEQQQQGEEGDHERIMREQQEKEEEEERRRLEILRIQQQQQEEEEERRRLEILRIQQQQQEEKEERRRLEEAEKQRQQQQQQQREVAEHKEVPAPTPTPTPTPRRGWKTIPHAPVASLEEIQREQGMEKKAHEESDNVVEQVKPTSPSSNPYGGKMNVVDLITLGAPPKKAWKQIAQVKPQPIVLTKPKPAATPAVTPVKESSKVTGIG